MKEILEIYGNFGALVLIFILYVYEKFKQSKINDKTMAEIKSNWDSTKPVIDLLRDETVGRTTVLNAMQGSIDNVSAVVQGVDKITEYIGNNMLPLQSDIREIRAMLNKGGDFLA